MEKTFIPGMMEEPKVERKILKRIVITVYDEGNNQFTTSVENFAANFWHAMEEMASATKVVAATFLREAKLGNVDDQGTHVNATSPIFVPDKEIQKKLGIH